jgi:hypothetical protein
MNFHEMGHFTKTPGCKKKHTRGENKSDFIITCIRQKQSIVYFFYFFIFYFYVHVLQIVLPVILARNMSAP